MTALAKWRRARPNGVYAVAWQQGEGLKATGDCPENHVIDVITRTLLPS